MMPKSVAIITIILFIAIFSFGYPFKSESKEDFIFYNVTYVYGSDNQTILDYYLTEINKTQFFGSVCRIWVVDLSDNSSLYSCTSKYVVEVPYGK